LRHRGWGWEGTLKVLFIHGAGGGSATWQLQLRHFEGSIAIELPGHPNGSGLRTIPEYVAVVEDYVRRHGIEYPVLVGHSMGGAISMEFALRNPRLAGLVLVGTGARLRVHPHILTKINENYNEAAKLIASWSVSPKSDPIMTDRLAAELLKVRPEVTYGDFLACNDFDRMNEIERISAPTLVICGADDQLTPVKYSQYLHQHIRNSKLVVIPGAGHSVMLEKPREFNAALEAFLASLEAFDSEA